MTSPRAFFKRLGELVRSRNVDRDLHDELDAHLDLLTDEFVRRGMSRDDARAAARRDFGGVDQRAEAVRDRRGFRVVDAMLQDVRYAVRLLVKSPSFTITAIVTLALGIGATTAVFSLVDAVLLRPLPYPDESRLMSINEFSVGPLPSVISTRGATLAAPTAAAPRPMSVSPANLVDYQRARGTSRPSRPSPASPGTSRAPGTPERLLGEQVAWNYLSVLGCNRRPAAIFSPRTIGRARHRVAFLSTRRCWRSRFGGDPAILQRIVQLDGLPYAIIGILPDTFLPISQFGKPDPVTFWSRLRSRPICSPATATTKSTLSADCSMARR